MPWSSGPWPRSRQPSILPQLDPHSARGRRRRPRTSFRRRGRPTLSGKPAVPAFQGSRAVAPAAGRPRQARRAQTPDRRALAPACVLSRVRQAAPAEITASGGQNEGLRDPGSVPTFSKRFVQCGNERRHQCLRKSSSASCGIFPPRSFPSVSLRNRGTGFSGAASQARRPFLVGAVNGALASAKLSERLAA